jgi:tRNA(Ile)-lysidine synthase
LDIFQKLENYIVANALLDKQKSVLVAVSGGVDSVVLLDALLCLGYECEVAHCNFHLRGKASNDSAKFVQQLSEKHGLKSHFTEFDTKEVADKSGESIEMTARNLRYSWFKTLLQKHDFQAVAVAHHKNDNAETILMNLARGTGVRGLAGIKPKREMIVRPLLCVNRSEIEVYAKNKNLKWCEDKTNKDIDFQRNRIRHKIIPELKKINPSFVETMHKFAENMSSTTAIYNFALDHLCKTIITNDNGICKVNIPLLLKCPATKTVLFEILQQFDFKSIMIDKIFSVLQSQSGKKFFSASHQLIKNRNELIISTLQNTETKQFVIKEGIQNIEDPIKLSFEILDRKTVKYLNTPKNIALLDYEQLIFPLMLRHWRYSDRFRPFGLNGFQNLSDFFINQKLSLIEKDNVWLLESGTKIAWIINHRIDGRFMIRKGTKKILKIIF